MAYEDSAGLNVHNHYGVRDTGAAIGVETGRSSRKVIRIDLTGRSVNEQFVPPVVLPKGVRFVRFSLRVDEAFVITGTNATVRLGAEGSATTNGIVLTEAQLETVGTQLVTTQGAGTWAVNHATGTAAAAAIVFAAMGGTDNPATDPTVGKATLFMEYLDVAKA